MTSSRNDSGEFIAISDSHVGSTCVVSHTCSGCIFETASGNLCATIVNNGSRVGHLFTSSDGHLRSGLGARTSLPYGNAILAHSQNITSHAGSNGLPCASLFIPVHQFAGFCAFGAIDNVFGGIAFKYFECGQLNNVGSIRQSKGIASLNQLLSLFVHKTGIVFQLADVRRNYGDFGSTGQVFIFAAELASRSVGIESVRNGNQFNSAVNGEILTTFGIHFSFQEIGTFSPVDIFQSADNCCAAANLKSTDTICVGSHGLRFLENNCTFSTALQNRNLNGYWLLGNQSVIHVTKNCLVAHFFGSLSKAHSTHDAQ